MAYEVEDSRVTHEGQLSTVRVDRVVMPDGKVTEREVVEHPSAVAVVAVDVDGRVVLLRQYRHPVGGYLLELPAGKLDVDGESPEDAARRELVEEAGVAAGELVELVAFHNSAGWNDERTIVYLSADVDDAEAPDGFTAEAEEADMQVVRMPLAEAVAMAERGEITDAKTIVGLLVAGGRLLRG